MDDDKKFVLSLSLGLGTIVTQKHVDLAYKEAYSYPNASKGRIAFIKLAERLYEEAKRQEELDATVSTKRKQ